MPPKSATSKISSLVRPYFLPRFVQYTTASIRPAAIIMAYQNMLKLPIWKASRLITMSPENRFGNSVRMLYLSIFISFIF